MSKTAHATAPQEQPPTPGRMVVTGVGAATSLGGSVTAAAGFRAGLTRPSELEEWTVLDEESGESLPMSGHVVERAAGFQGAGRLAVLAALGLVDLKETLGDSWPSTQLILGIPDLRDRFVADADESPEDRRELEQELARHRQLIAARAVEHAGVDVPLGQVHVRAISSAGFCSALAQAQKLLDARACDRCVVGAVDSFIDADVLEALADAGRLKDPETPTGLAPGEGSAFVCLERADAGAASTAVGRIGFLAMGRTQDHRYSDRPPLGGPWADAAMSALPDGDEPPFLVVDHAGESHRAQELGEAIVRLIGQRPHMRAAVTWFPAIGFGDVGSAFTPLAIVLACRAWARGYAPSLSALVMAASDCGQRAAIRIDAPQGSSLS